MTSTSDIGRQTPISITFLVAINAFIGSVLLYAWPTLAPKLAAPFGWAFGKAISTQLSIWEPPFMLMWVVPFLAAGIGFVLDKFEQTGWAVLVLVLPSVTTLATILLFRIFG